MAKQRHLITAAKFRQFTPFKRHLRNMTRWISKFTILERYTKLWEFIDKLGIVIIDKLGIVIMFFETPHDFDSVTEIIQDP